MKKFSTLLIVFFFLSYAKAQSVFQNWASLATGSAPIAIAIDASGNSYIANNGANTVSKITPSGTVTQTWATLGTGANPVAIVIDASGNLYTANYSNNTISKITPAGTVTQAWATLDSGSTMVAIAIDASGNVYTANYNKTVSKITSAGAVTAAWATLAVAPSTYPQSIAIDASDNVYIASGTGDRVSKITPAGDVTQVWATLASGANPAAIAKDASGNFYTANGNNTVSKITPTGTVTAAWATLAFGANPKGIVLDASGNVYTANGNNTISKITSAGTATTAWATLATAPNTIVIDANSSSLYTPNPVNHTVSRIYYCHPTISTHPAGQTICGGSATSFSVTATATQGNLSYQWQINGTNISGATAATYNIAAASGADAGNYTVVVSDGCGVMLSNTATLMVQGATTANVVTTTPKRCGMNGSIELNTLTGNTNIGSNSFSSTIATPWSVGGSAAINNGQMQLHTAAANTNGYLLLTPTATPANFSASFDLNMYRSTTINSGAGTGDGVADGISFNYGDITTPSGDYENGILSGNGLVVRYKIHQTQRIEVVYNGSVKGTYYTDLHYPTALKCMIAVTDDGKFSLRLGDNILVNNLDLGTAYATDNKSAWKFGWAARSGASYERHALDNIVIDNNNSLLYSIDDFATQQSIPYFSTVSGSYTVKSKSASCTTPSIVSTATIPAFSIPNLNITEGGIAPTCARTISLTHTPLPYDTLVWSDFATRPTISNANNLGNATFNGSASLTTNGSDQNGRVVFNTTKNASVFKATFNARIWDGSGADGISFNYGAIDNISGGQAGMFNNFTEGLTVSFLTFNGGKVRVKYRNAQLGSDYSASIRNNSYIPIEISVDEDYKLTVKVNGATIVNAYDLFTTSAYPFVDHSNWQFGIGGFTGGSNDNHNIDNLLITGKPGMYYAAQGSAYRSSVTSIVVGQPTEAQTVTVFMDGCNTLTQFPAWGTTNTIITSNSSQTATVPATFGSCGPYLITHISSVGGSAPYQGLTTAQVWIENTQPTNFVKRHYQITPDASATGTEAFVRLYFTQAEFDAFNAVNTSKLPTSSSDAAGIANLLIEQRSGSSNDGTGLPASYTGTNTTINPTDNQIFWIAAKNVWEVGFYVSGFSGFFVKTQPAALPVELVSFKASAQNGSNLLTWRTASEINNLGFDVERSQDGISFETIAHVKGNNEPTTYQYRDNVVYNTTYYRLKQMDYDGTTSYSNIVSVVQKGIKKGLKIYPTLVSNNILNIETEGVSTAYSIYNLMGQMVMKGNTDQAIDISALHQGTYIVRVGTETAKFMKQ